MDLGPTRTLTLKDSLLLLKDSCFPSFEINEAAVITTPVTNVGLYLNKENKAQLAFKLMVMRRGEAEANACKKLCCLGITAGFLAFGDVIWQKIHSHII
jgi:hypothetical protein